MILYGPPGTGKTTLARMLAVNARAAFEEESAVAGRAEVRAVLERATHRRSNERRAHDLLPRRDPPLQQGPAGHAPARGRGGTVALVGATTENPYFEVNSALLSRCRIYELRPLDEDHVLALLRRALGAERGIRASPTGRRRRARVPGRRAAGDARTALSALELAAETVGDGGRRDPAGGGGRPPASAILYDKGGDLHYDLILGVDQVHARVRP